ncbi:hypothetical protein HPULCUR_011349 [Helicostylum pulchrum]|uniref:Uncharacterized protein n=1 Tax=Helicostylum pulchrum TaxID=562976 RepID=A0ABP9YGW0_9FUNG
MRQWIDYVERNFDATKVSEIQKRKNIVETSKNKQAETASIPSKGMEAQYRTFSVSMKKSLEMIYRWRY